MTHKTKGIVLKYIEFGDTSLIVSIFTELFGIQKYILKGIKTSTRKNQNKISYFQPGSILDLVVYKNDLKDLQFIKEYNHAIKFETIFYNVVKNSILTFFLELFSNTVWQSEPGEELYYFLEKYIILLDQIAANESANLPLFFSLELSKQAGFQINGAYTSTNNIIDLLEGNFVNDIPNHNYYIEKEPAKITSVINRTLDNPLAFSMSLNRKIRFQLLNYYELYFTLHIENFNKLKSLPILKSIF